MRAANPQRERPGPVIRMIMRLLPKITLGHVWLYKGLGGRIVSRNPLGPPLLLVTTIGRCGEKPRAVMVAHLRSGDDVFVMGTNGGLPKLPAWVRNLRAHPKAEVEPGRERYSVVAEFLAGDDWQHRWDQLVNVFSSYEDAVRWSGGRRFPLIRLRRTSGIPE